jgi:ribonucleoside-triphosphate reductase
VEITIGSAQEGKPATALPLAVIKRDGALKPFDATKIAAALARAGAATGEFGEREAARLAAQAVKVIAHRFAGATPTIENIQDVAEQVLIAADHIATARAYIVPRRLAEALPLVDWVAMDAKAPFEGHERVTRVAGSGARARRSAELLRASPVACEFHAIDAPDLI